MAYQYGLAKLEAPCNGLHTLAHSLGVLAALFAVVLESLGAIFCALHQVLIVVLYVTG
jgi:hypothetical protein